MAIEKSSVYSLLDQSNSKPLVFVLVVDGTPWIYGTTVIQQALRYGDAGAFYGTPGLVYGGTLPFGGLGESGGYNKNKQRPYLNVDSGGLTISQRSEPWEGRASVSQLTFKLTDINSEVLNAVSPGTGKEPLLKRAKFYVGFEQSSYPEDYILLTQGLISEVQCEPGLITLVTSDPNLIRRQKLFESAKTGLTSAIDASVTTIGVGSTSGFSSLVRAPGSESPEPGHKVGLKIDDEIITYTQDPDGVTFYNVTRGALGTVAASHDADAEVTPVFVHEGNPLLIACKLMLSGWAGASEFGVPVKSVVQTGDPDNPIVEASYIFGVDLIAEYGLTVGDFVSVSGTIKPKNVIFERPILSFFDVVGVKNAGVVLQLEAAPDAELASTGKASFRSQFDVYPTGLKMSMQDVDTKRHLDIASQFLSTDVANFYFVQTKEVDSGKDFIEKQCYLPCGAFSLTRSGKCSVVLTSQPLPGADLVKINADNVIDPDKVKLTRGVTSRKFYNRVDFALNYDPIEDDYARLIKYIDSDSLQAIPYKEYLQIESAGMRLERNAQALIDRAKRKIFDRYSRAAQTITFKCTWALGATLEAGDVVLVDDQGTLNLPNLQTGQRGLGLQLWEILEKSTDLKTGVSTVTMISAAGTVTDRFGLISPSSEIESGKSATKFRITDSFGALYPNAEDRKWRDFVGYKVSVHSPDYSFSEESTLVSIDEQDPYLFTVSPPFTSTPSSGWILELAHYQGTATEETLAKLVHAYLSPTVYTVGGGMDGPGATEFEVAPGDVSKFFVGAKLEIYTDNSEVEFITATEVLSISGNFITVRDTNRLLVGGLRIEGIGFSSDRSEPYRFYS